MRIRDEISAVEIMPMERFGQAPPGDLRLHVSVSAGGFQGSYDQVWVGANEFEDFLRQLANLEEARRGGAVLRSITPGEFELVIAATDRSGHIAAHGFLARRQGSLPGSSESRVAFDIKIDPTALPGLLEALHELQLSIPFRAPENE
jgi:hypothetical protein